eukprot:scaffold49967_cov47-Prasinocladus_malaysianus.AAC.3
MATLQRVGGQSVDVYWCTRRQCRRPIRVYAHQVRSPGQQLPQWRPLHARRGPCSGRMGPIGTHPLLEGGLGVSACAVYPPPHGCQHGILLKFLVVIALRACLFEH